ncbi:MAG: hypothetical protein ACOCRU_02885, partial [bacterium]
KSSILKVDKPTLWNEIKLILNYKVFDRLSDVNELDYNDFIEGNCEIRSFVDNNKPTNGLVIITPYGKRITVRRMN